MKRLNHLFLLVAWMLMVGCDGSEEDPQPMPPASNLPEGSVTFSTSPLDLTGVNFYEPMGRFGVFPQDHGGFHHNEIFVIEPQTEIYALADGEINALGRSGDDFWIQVKYSTTISVKLGHVGRFADFILNETGALVDGQPKYPTIEVQQGQVIGYVSAFSALDMGLHDLEINNGFCYPENFGFELRYAADIFDYFNEPVKSQLKATSIRPEEPRGGRVVYDVKGTLAGNWFQPGSGDLGDFGSHLAIGYDHLYPARLRLFDGFNFAQGSQEHQFWIKNNGPLPENVDQNTGLVKYEMINGRSYSTPDGGTTWELLPLDVSIDQQSVLGTFLFEILGTERMRAEYFSGQTAAEVNGFSGNERIYIRNP